jgi:hypothetical protein
MPLPSIDFTSSPLPANGLPRSAAGEAAVWLNIQTVYNAMAAAATNAPTASTVALRDGSGGIQFTGLGLIPAVGASPAVNVQAPTGYTGNPFQYTLNGVNKIIGDSTGNLTLAGQLAAATAAISGISTFTGAATFNGAAVFNGAVTLSSSLFAALISDYRPGTSGTAGHVALAAGGAYTDSGGNQVGPVGTATDVNVVGTVPQPSGTNSVYVAVSAPVGWNGTAANLTLTAGTAAVSPTKPGVPSGNWGVAMLLWRGPSASAGAGANAGGVFLASDIGDIRFPGGGGSGGGSGTTDATVRSAPLMSFGASGYGGGSLDMSAVQATAFVNAANSKTGANDGTIMGPLTNVVQADTPARMTTVGASASITASASSPWSVSIGGTIRTLTTALSTAAASGSSGVRYLIVDVSGGSGATAALSASNSTTTKQMAIAQFWYDSGTATLLDTGAGVNGIAPDFSVIGGTLSPAVTLTTALAKDLTGGTMAATLPATWTKIPTWGQTSFRLAAPARLRLSMALFYSIVLGTTTSIQVAPLIDGATSSTFATQIFQASASFATSFWSQTLEAPLAAGLHTLSMGIQVPGGGTGTFSTAAGGCYVTAEIFKG